MREAWNAWSEMGGNKGSSSTAVNFYMKKVQASWRQKMGRKAEKRRIRQNLRGYWTGSKAKISYFELNLLSNARVKLKYVPLKQNMIKHCNLWMMVFVNVTWFLKSQERILFLQVIRLTFALAKVFLLVPAHSGGKFSDGQHLSSIWQPRATLPGNSKACCRAHCSSTLSSIATHKLYPLYKHLRRNGSLGRFNYA